MICFLRLASSALLAADQPDRLPQRSERLHREEGGREPGLELCMPSLDLRLFHYPACTCLVSTRRKGRGMKRDCGSQTAGFQADGAQDSGSWTLCLRREDLVLKHRLFRLFPRVCVAAVYIPPDGKDSFKCNTGMQYCTFISCVA